MIAAPHHPNFGQWAAVAYFLAGLRRSAPVLPRTAGAAPGTGAAVGFQAAGFQALPDGNHGDNKRSIK